MFVGRETELKEFRRIFNSDRFEFVVVYGRRRIGKTTLISKACEGFTTIFHLATKTTEKKTLSDLVVSMYEGLGEGEGLSFRDLDAFLDYVGKKSSDRAIVLVIDELPFLAKSIPDAMGSLQRFIDLKASKTKLKLVLSGSSVSFMEHQVLGDKSPLYGRRTAQIRLLPFDLQETRRLYRGSLEETALVQMISGGVPLYISYFSLEESLEKNIQRLFYNSNGLLYNEPLNILNMEVNEPQTFFTVLELLAHGANKQVELADKSGMSSPNMSYYLSTLQEIGLVDKKLPFGEKNRNRTIWYIKDGLFLFYFKHVHQFRTMIERGLTDGVLAWLGKTLRTSFGKQFEEICKTHVLRNADHPIIKIGSWWGSDPISRREEEIDVVAQTIEGTMIFGECKFTNDPMASNEYDDLVRISKNVKGGKNMQYWFFSASGFTNALCEKAQGDQAVRLVYLKDLFV